MMSGSIYTYPVHLSTATVAQLVEQLIRNTLAYHAGERRSATTPSLISSISCQLTVQFICQFGRHQASQGISYA